MMRLFQSGSENFQATFLPWPLTCTELNKALISSGISFLHFASKSQTIVSPVHANPEVTEESRSRMAAVGFARPFVSTKFLQLTQAVGKQHVRQLLVSQTCQVVRFVQLQLRPGGGRQVRAVVHGPCCEIVSWSSAGDAHKDASVALFTKGENTSVPLAKISSSCGQQCCCLWFSGHRSAAFHSRLQTSSKDVDAT